MVPASMAAAHTERVSSRGQPSADLDPYFMVVQCTARIVIGEHSEDGDRLQRVESPCGKVVGAGAGILRQAVLRATPVSVRPEMCRCIAPCRSTEILDGW